MFFITYDSNNVLKLIFFVYIDTFIYTIIPIILITKCKPASILQNLTSYPGVYQMFNSYGKILYIGKAKNLKNRLNQYFNKNNLTLKNATLMAKVCSIEVIATKTETQALLLENNLIKTHKPKYNILLKDDKSYPYILVSKHKYPRVGFYRGNKKEHNTYFGPYPSSHIVKNSLSLLKKIFKVRQCSDSFYRNRSRPCLEYQLNLCSAPCVNYINIEDYREDIKTMELFLSGKDREILKIIAQKMQEASTELNFELAAHYRDQLQQLSNIQSQTKSNLVGNIDVIAIAQYQGLLCIEVLFVRQGKQIGNDSFYPKNKAQLSINEVLSAFLVLYYLDRPITSELVISEKLADKKLLADTLKTRIVTQPKLAKKSYLDNVILTAKIKVKQHYKQSLIANKNLLNLQKILSLNTLPKHIECFDISHMMGEATIASCVVFIDAVAKKSLYRKFNINNITAGDDYAAIGQVVSRRYSRLIADNKPLPDLLFVDGGLGQLTQTMAVLKSLAINIKVVGVAKGEARKVGLETLIIIDDNGEIQKIKLKANDNTLMLIARIRDEAHRFAISGHRKKIRTIKTTSILENISGIGAKKRRALLNHFGGLTGIKAASVMEIAKVSGINTVLANKIYQSFRQL